jgi:hypothetical protein
VDLVYGLSGGALCQIPLGASGGGLSSAFCLLTLLGFFAVRRRNRALGGRRWRW